MKIFFKKLHVDAVIPSAAKEGDVGYDLRSIEDIDLAPGKVTKVHTGICIAHYDASLILNGGVITIYPEIKSRSGLASNSIFTVGGIIDTQYRGELIVLLMNATKNEFRIWKHDKCAQLVFTACLTTPSLSFEEMTEIKMTERGVSGFGSSDKT